MAIINFVLCHGFLFFCFCLFLVFKIFLHVIGFSCSFHFCVTFFSPLYFFAPYFCLSSIRNDSQWRNLAGFCLSTVILEILDTNFYTTRPDRVTWITLRRQTCQKKTKKKKPTTLQVKHRSQTFHFLQTFLGFGDPCPLSRKLVLLNQVPRNIGLMS